MKQHMERTPKNILVTGGGGFLGKAIVKLLVNRGDRVRSIARNFYPELEALGVEQIQGDISDFISVQKACKGIKLVFHVAAKPGVWGRYSEYYKTNVTGTRNVIKACKENDMPALVYSSSPSVIFDGTDMEGVDESAPYPETYHTHYQKTKALAEQEVLNAAKNGLKTIILRPHLIWGPGDNHLVPRIIQRAKRLIRIGAGQNLVDTIFITNAAAAHILAADKLEENHSLSGNIYFISQDDPILLWDMIDRILETAGLGPVKKTMSPKSAWTIGAILEIFYKIFNIKSEPQMTRFVAQELASSHWYDISAAKRDLGYSPSISIEEGLEQLKVSLSEQDA
jgi:nucleoside-diphosphate-sugar epimerase